MNPPARFNVIPLGAGNFFGVRRFNTSLILAAGDRQILVDVPEPFFRMCALASERSGYHIDPEEIDLIVLTHMHGDHCNGLEGFGFWKKFISKIARRPRVYTSREAADVLWDKLAVSMGKAVLPPDGSVHYFNLEDYYELHPFNIGESFEVAGIQFQTRRTLHSIPTFGFRATFEGRCFGYSCDTCFDPDHIAFLEPADLIFHECDKGFHTALEDLETLPEEIRKKMRLIHLNDEFTGSDKIEAAEEGRVYPV